MDKGRYPIYDAEAYEDLACDEEWLADLADRLATPLSEIGDETIWGVISDESSIAFREEVEQIDERIRERVADLKPVWGDFQLMATGSVGRWDGTTHGHTYYPDFASLVGDTGYDGLFKDCEIRDIWEDREGTLHVTGIHHDGAVQVAVRAVEGDTEELEGDYYEWNGALSEDNAWARSDMLQHRWDTGVTCDMASLFGYEWPDAQNLDSWCEDADLRAALHVPADFHARDVGGYEVGLRSCRKLGEDYDEPYRLELVSNGVAWYSVPGADEAGGTVMLNVGPDGPDALLSDNFLAWNAFSEACDAIAGGVSTIDFASSEARLAIEESRKVIETERTSPARNAEEASRIANSAGRSGTVPDMTVRR